FEQCWAGVYDLPQGKWTRQYQVGFDPEVVAAWEGREWDDLASTEPSLVAIRTGTPVMISSTLLSTEFAEVSHRSEQEGYRSSLYVPVQLSRDEWTVLSLHRSVEHEFSPSEQSLAAAIATFAAVAFRNALAR